MSPFIRNIIIFLFPIAINSYIQPIRANFLWGNQKLECRENSKKKYSIVELSKKSREGVVVISTDTGSGSGFVFKHSKNRTFIITNSHVINGAKKVLVAWDNGFEDIAKVDIDAGGSGDLNDLAIVSLNGIHGKVLSFKKNDIEVGTEVIAVGAPMGFDFTFTRGIISSMRNEKKIVQTDAAVNPGNSGGPLIDMKGCVVGINTFGYTESEGLNFSIASKVVKRFINKFSEPQLKAFKKEKYKLEIKSLCSTNNQICETDKEARKKIISADKIIAFNSKIEEAKKLASDSLAIQESDYAYMLRGKANYFLEEDEDALEDLTKALRINPLLIEASFLRGLLYKESDSYSESIRDFKWVIKKAKTKELISRANLEIVDINIKKGNVIEAVEILDKTINDEKNNKNLEDLYLKRSEINFYLRKTDESINDANKALKINRSSHQAYYWIGMNQDYLKDYQSALEYYYGSLEINPNFSNAYMQIGVIQSRVFKEHEASIESLNKAIELDPQNAEAYIHRGVVLVLHYKLPRGCVDLKTGKNLDLIGFTADSYRNMADIGLNFSFCKKIYD